MAETRAQFLARIGQPAGGAGRALKYDPAHCDRILCLACTGEFPEAWAKDIGVCLETFRLWSRRYPAFREAIDMAHLHLLNYWTQDLVRNLNNPKARPGLYALLMRRFPAVFGRNPVDLIGWMLDGEADSPPALHDLPDEELHRRLDELRARRAAETA
jgi:hypothetical protein